jgi:hypothetical protein
MKRKAILNRSELNVLLNRMGVEYRPSYKHEDYILTSVSLPYPVKDKLDSLSKKYGATRSSLIAELIKGCK